MGSGMMPGQAPPGGGFGMGAFGATEQLLMGNAFQQPFAPQDMWQMPMSFEWDFADLSQSYAGNLDHSFEINGAMNGISTAQQNGENGVGPGAEGS